MQRPSRRTLLSSSAMLLASLAGCLGPTREYSSEQTTTTATSTLTTTNPTATPTPTYDVDVNSVTVVPELVAMDSPDSTSTIGTRDEQFVVAEIGSWAEVDLSFQDFTLATNGETYQLDQWGRRTDQGNSLWPLYGDLFETESAGYLVFRLPKPLDSESVSLEWPGGSHELDANSLSKLTRPPADLLMYELSADLQDDGLADVDVTVEVRNRSSVGGTFVGALDRVGPNVAYTPEEAIVLEVPAKETATWSHRFSLKLPPSGQYARASFLLDWRRGDKGVVVDLREDES